MNIGTALDIFEHVKDTPYTIETKGLAIRKVIDMDTHNSVTKKSMMDVIEWLWDMVFEMRQEEER